MKLLLVLRIIFSFKQLFTHIWKICSQVLTALLKNKIFKCSARLIFFSAIIIYAAYIYDYHYYNSYEAIPPIEKQIPFWKDNRTYQTGRSVPTPITTVDRVNLSNLTVAFGACCRNVYEFLPGFKKHIQEFGSLFKEYRVFFGESDSEDGTVEFLQRWANEDPRHVDVFSGGKQVYTTSIFRKILN